MNDITTTQNADLLGLTASIVSAFVSNHQVENLPELIATTHGALVGLTAEKQEQPVELTPAVPIRKSVTSDYIVCLEDGKKVKTLKRYIQRVYGLTPAEYRAKWNLPADYPMTCPSYSAKRSEMAKTIGLGRKKGEVAPKAKAPKKAKVEAATEAA